MVWAGNGTRWWAAVTPSSPRRHFLTRDQPHTSFFHRIQLNLIIILFLQVRAAVKAAPVSIPMKKLDGSDSGNASIGLRVADADTSTGVVHRYITLVRQNMRQVRYDP